MLGNGVVGNLGYLAAPRERAFQYMHAPPEGTEQTNCGYDMRPCRISNARLVASSVSLETTGFQLYDAPSMVTDFHDQEQITDNYYREAEEIARHVTGGVKAIVFDHLLRQREKGRPALGMGRHGDGSNPSAVGRVHNDYSERSGKRRLNMVLPDTHSDFPFVILNLWRPVSYPAVDTPLAVCDARSFPRRDWLECDIIYPDRKGEIYLGRHSSDHHWYYYPEMHPGEVLAFKTYDSRSDVPARMTPHCAFDDWTAPRDAPPRRSMEVRCLVILE
ncbi:CmcJ/NvfI family oxidoreductase [Noviherbaspirillum sp.]|uniref:CmcJ/NvfI family oxidoreductase n=1 Tax=Noviherbaspirillum sp. TaxID=1926288 RepID=UPI002FE21B56